MGGLRKVLADGGYTFTDSEWANIERYSSVFDEYDKSGDGQLDVSELSTLLSTKCSSLNPKKVLDAVDIDKDGKVSKVEYIKALTGCDLQAPYMCMFNTFDKDGDGKVSCAELLEALGKSSSDANMATAKKLVAEMDRDGDGVLDPSEFCAKFTNSMIKKK